MNLHRQYPGWFSWLIALSWAALAPAQAQTVDAADMLLHWDAGQGRAQIWCVRGEAGACFDLINAPGALVAQHLTLDGRIGGEPLGDSRLSISHHFSRRGDADYRLQLTLRAENRSERALSPGTDDRLWLQLGPGLGDQHTAGLGYAEGLYSYIEAVAMQAGQLLQLRPENNRFTALTSDERPVQWFGLHGRHFALLLSPLDGHNRARAGVALAATQNLFDSHGAFNPAHQVMLRWPLMLSPLGPGEVQQWQFEIYAGPKAPATLQAGEIQYDAVLMPGIWAWLRALALGLMWVLAAIHSVLPSWGLAIIALAILVRLLLYPLARNALRQQQRFVKAQQQLAPALAEIRNRYRGEEQSERILALYAEQGVSPLAGLKPLLIVLLQLPILIALFHGLGSAWALRDAGFLWIDSLAEPDRLLPLGVTLPWLGDHLNLLPLLMTVVSLMALRLSPPPAADGAARRRQNLGLIVMALVFLVLFYPFPSGMVLYWTAANLLHIGQQWLVTRQSSRVE